MNQKGRLQGTPNEDSVSQISGGLGSPPQAMEPSTKGTASNMRHSQMVFANDIAQGLIHEVRKLQTTIQEKDRIMKDMEINMADGEKEKELAQRYLRQKTISEEKLKEDNWNLEVENQDLQANQTELNQTIVKLNVDHKKCLQDLRTSLEQMEIIKVQQEKTTATMDAMKARHDHEQQLLRRNNGILHRDMIQLKKQLDVANTDLKICRSKLAIKATADSNNTNANVNYQQMYGNKVNGTVDGEVYESLDEGDTSKDNLTANNSGLTAISQQRALEIDTLKQSLGHAHRMISSLRNNLQKEKVEKIELKKLLMDTQESMDQLQKSVANHDANHPGRGQSKKNAGTNRTKVVRKRGAVGRKAVATTKSIHEFSGDNRQEFSAVGPALDGNDDSDHNNGIQVRLDQDDFLSCDDDTSADDSSSVDEDNNGDSDSGGENDCHQLDLSYSGQGQSLDMELKLGGFDAPFKPLSSELEESNTKRQCVDKGVNTTGNFEQISLRTWQQSPSMEDSATVNTSNDNITTNDSGKSHNGIDGGCINTENGYNTSENTHDIHHSIGGSIPRQHSASTIPAQNPLSSAAHVLVNLAPLDSMPSPIPTSYTVNQPPQQSQQQMDSESQLLNADAQNNTVSQQEGMATPLPGSPVSSHRCPTPMQPVANENAEPLVTNAGFESQGPIPIIENTTMYTNPSRNKSNSSVSLTNQTEDGTKPSAVIIEQKPSGIDLDNELVIGATQIPKASAPAPPVSNNDLIISQSSDGECQGSVTPSSTQPDDSFTPLSDKIDKVLELAILTPPEIDEQRITVDGKNDTHSNSEPVMAVATTGNSRPVNEEPQLSSAFLTKSDSLDTAMVITKSDSFDTPMDTHTKTEELDDTIDNDNCESTLDISNMMSRDEAEALIKAGIADALEKERVESAARQEQDLSNNFVTLVEAEVMARDRTEAALKKERDRTSTMVTKTQADIMARAYAEQAIQENDDKRHSQEFTRKTTVTSSFLAKVKTSTSMQDEPSVSRASSQHRASHTYMAPTPQPSTSTASTASTTTTSSTSSRRSILSGLMKLQPSISTPAKTMRLRPSASTSSLRKTITSSSSSSSSKPPHAQRQMSNNALHHRYKATADQHLQLPPSSGPSYGTVRITETSTYPRKPSSEQGHLRKPSLHSLSSNMSKKSGLVPPSLFAFPMGAGDPSQHHSSAELISAITQTMIGEWMWKHTRKHMGGGISENKHKRFFWVHPYTRTLYWGTNEPGMDADEAKAKSAFIESVSSIPSSDTMGASPLSLLIKTAKRDLKLTAQSLERHELWRTSLSYLLVPPGEDYPVMEDVIQVDPFHNDPDTTTLATTTGSDSTQTLPIAATNTTCHDLPADGDTHDDATTKDDSITPIMQQDPPEDDDDHNSKTHGLDSTKSDDHGVDVDASSNMTAKAG